MANFKYKDEWKLYQKESKLDQSYYKKNQELLNSWNMESAQKQMDFQKMMSDTSHQREVQDLLKAGLNPVLSANNGASTPSGAYANIDSSPMTSASQSRIANRQMRQQMIEQKMSLRNQMAIARYQAQMQFAAQKYATDMNYQLGMAGYENQLTIANLPYVEGNVNQTEKYLNENTSANTTYSVDNPNTLSGALVKALQGALDVVYGTKGQSLRQQSMSMSNPLYLLKRGLQLAATGNKLGLALVANRQKAVTAANALKNSRINLKDFVGDIGYIPSGRPYHNNGKPYTDKELKNLIVHYHPKSRGKVSRKTYNYYNAYNYIYDKRNYRNK